MVESYTIRKIQPHGSENYGVPVILRVCLINKNQNPSLLDNSKHTPYFNQVSGAYNGVYVSVPADFKPKTGGFKHKPNVFSKNDFFCLVNPTEVHTFAA